MAASLRKLPQSGVLSSCFTKQIRVVLCAHYRIKAKVKKQKPMSRRVYEIVTKPLYDDPPKYLKGSCLSPSNKVNKDDENMLTEYEEFLIGQLRKEVESSRMFIICHMLPCIPPRREMLRLQLRAEGVKLGHLSNTMMKEVIKDTRYANLQPLLSGNNAKLTSPDFKVKQVVKLLKKFPEFQILGGFVEDQLVCRQDVIAMSQLPDLDLQRGQLAAILNQVGGARTLALLNHHQQTLVTNLGQYQKDSSSQNESQNT